MRGISASIPRSVVVLLLTVGAFAPAHDALAAESPPQPGTPQGHPPAPPQTTVPEETTRPDPATVPAKAPPEPATSPEEKAEPPATVGDASPPTTGPTGSPAASVDAPEQQSGAPADPGGTPAAEDTSPAEDTAAAEAAGAVQHATALTRDDRTSAKTGTPRQRSETSDQAPPAPAPTEEAPRAAACGPCSGALTPTVQSEGTSAERATQDAREACFQAGALCSWFAPRGSDGASCRLAPAEHAVLTLASGALAISSNALLTSISPTLLRTVVGGALKAGSTVPRLRTKRAARAARVMPSPKRLPDRRLPHAPRVAAGVGGAPANSGSGVRHFAALAPGFILVRLDRAGRPLCRDATEGPAVFVSPIERPG